MQSKELMKTKCKKIKMRIIKMMMKINKMRMSMETKVKMKLSFGKNSMMTITKVH